MFLKEELPYTIFSGVQFYGRREIKDALSYLRLIAYGDDLSFMRVANAPKRNLGERRMRFLQEYSAKNGCPLYSALERTIDDDIFKITKAKKLLNLVERFTALRQEMPISELFSKLLDESGYEEMLRTEGSQERLDNLAELKQSVYEYETMCGEETTLESYLAHVALMTNSDNESSRDTVKMMTVHAPRGWNSLRLHLRLKRGIFPSKKTLTLEGMEEERRLCFVAFTRAEKGLFLTNAEGRNHDGSHRYPSRFIFNVDRSLLTYTNELDPRIVSDGRLAVEANEKMLELRSLGPAFGAGDRIVHSIMGAGEILDVDRGSAPTSSIRQPPLAQDQHEGYTGEGIAMLTIEECKPCWTILPRSFRRSFR